MSRYKTLLLAGLLLAGTTGTASAQLRVFACEPEWQALSQAIGGDRVDAWSATTAEDDPHHVQARPSLIAKLRRADLLICTGAELESAWLPLLLRRARNPVVQPGQPGHLMAAAQVSLLEVPARLDRSDGDVHAQGNPHIQLDPRRLLQVSRALAQHLSTIDPAHAAEYESRLKSFTSKWQKAMAEWTERGAHLRGRGIVVQHTEWVYLLDWLGMHRTAALEPKPGVPPSAAHLATLKSELKKDSALAIVRAPQNDARPAQWLSAQTGIPVLVLPNTVEEDSGPEGLYALFDTVISRLENLASQP